ncbi:MAG: hypothetical protein K2M34_00255 [Alphaproteobacteria bacterium]|nr:hypothetical protein [Alphaproteobacteria bacterium]
MKIIYSMFCAFCITANAFAMADRTPPVYGVPTLYGEYEVSADDAARASKMYGNTPRPAAIRAGAIKNTPVAKHPVKAKKTAAKKKTAKKSKQVSVKKVKVAKLVPASEQTENIKDVSVAQKDVDKTPVVVSQHVPVASQDAVEIAARAAHRVDIESFCTQKKPQGRGNLPDGIIMMPGRPDLMSCTTNNKD